MVGWDCFLAVKAALGSSLGVCSFARSWLVRWACTLFLFVILGGFIVKRLKRVEGGDRVCTLLHSCTLGERLHSARGTVTKWDGAIT